MANILYVRSGPYELNFNNYNLQEVGLGKAFCEKGHNFDVMYYSKQDKNEVLEIEGRQLTLLWRKGIKILRTGIYPSILKEEFLKKYDAVIVSEYSQLMSYKIGRRHPNVYMYNGLYYNLFKLPFMQPIYDALYCKKLNKLMKKVFCKTEMAKDFIAKKGITNTIVTGVGLDATKFEEEKEIEEATQNLLDKMGDSRCLLYVGAISKRKNTELIIKSFINLKKNSQYKDVKLVLVGKGDGSYYDYCQSLIPKELSCDVIWCNFIKNAQMKFVYAKAEIFLLPSVQEIFGMVLLEAMYFSVPVISSYSAGASTLIKNNQNGITIQNFDVEEWTGEIQRLLDDKQFSEEIGRNAGVTIREEFMWDKIVDKMLKHIEVN